MPYLCVISSVSFDQFVLRIPPRCRYVNSKHKTNPWKLSTGETQLPSHLREALRLESVMNDIEAKAEAEYDFGQETLFRHHEL